MAHDISLVITNVSSSREVIGGGDIRILGIIYTLSRLNEKSSIKFKVALVSDKYYIERLLRLASNLRLGQVLNEVLDKSFSLRFPRYLPPYVFSRFVLKIILLFFNTLLRSPRYSRHYNPLIAVVSSNQLYQYVIAGLDFLSKGIAIYVQTPPYQRFHTILQRFTYVGFIKLVKLICKFRRVVIFAFNPVDFRFLNDIFKECSNVKVVLTLNGVFTEFIKYEGMPKREFDVIYVGRLDPKKRAFNNFVNFLKRLCEKGIYVKAAIVTSCLKEELQLVVKTLKCLSKCHEIKVYVNMSPEEVYELYSKARFLIMLSELDVFNLAILEALVNGCHVIVLNNPRLRYTYALLSRSLSQFKCLLHFVNNIDEAVEKYQRIANSKCLCMKNVSRLRNLRNIDWYYVFLKELKEMVSWFYRGSH